MLADNVRLADLNLSVHGRQAVLEETRRNFVSVEQLEIRIGTIHESVDRSVAAELQILIDGQVNLRVVGVIGFTRKGRIQSIRAYKGR